jgi:hypothetical protein
VDSVPANSPPFRRALIDAGPSARRHRLAYNDAAICYGPPCASVSTGRREIAMAKGQMRSNKEKKKPKADKNLKKGGATPSPFTSMSSLSQGKPPAGQSPYKK